jgi:hypothetical protein
MRGTECEHLKAATSNVKSKQQQSKANKRTECAMYAMMMQQIYICKIEPVCTTAAAGFCVPLLQAALALHGSAESLLPTETRTGNPATRVVVEL